MANSNYVAILAEVKSLLAAATDVGTKVYDYKRWAADWSTFLNLFKSNGLIKGWEITRRARGEEAGTSRTNKATHVFVIYGYYSVDDSARTEAPFQLILENICDKFRNVATLNNEALESLPIQVIIQEQRTLGSVLVHYAEMNLSVTEEIQYT